MVDYRVFIMLFSCFCMIISFSKWNTSIAETSTVKIKIVLDAERGDEPVSGVKCTLIKGAKTVGSKKTDSSGIAVFEELNPGTYFFWFQSNKFKKELKKWALPFQKGPERIEEGGNKLKIECKKAITVEGNIRYRGDISLNHAMITSYQSQFVEDVNENGTFLFHGVYPTENAEIYISLGDYRADYSPKYKKIIKLKPYGVKTGKKIDIGEIDFPYASKNENVRIDIIERTGDRLLSQTEVYNIRQKLIIRSDTEDVYFEGSSSILSVLIGKTPGKGIQIRLPSGEYQAWWKGYKHKQRYDFTITEDKQPEIEVKLPATND